MGRAKNRSEKRRLLRRRLEAQGYRAEQIERIVAQREAAADEKHEADERRRRLVEQEARLEESRAAGELVVESPDDSKYRPAKYDPLTVGVARVTGQTARAARRGMTVTAWQHRAQERRA